MRVLVIVAFIALGALIVALIRYLSRTEHTGHSSGTGQFSPNDPEGPTSGSLP